MTVEPVAGRSVIQGYSMLVEESFARIWMCQDSAPWIFSPMARRATLQRPSSAVRSARNYGNCRFRLDDWTPTIVMIEPLLWAASGCSTYDDESKAILQSISTFRSRCANTRFRNRTIARQKYHERYAICGPFRPERALYFSRDARISIKCLRITSPIMILSLEELRWYSGPTFWRKRVRRVS